MVFINSENYMAGLANALAGDSSFYYLVFTFDPSRLICGILLSN